MTKKPFCHFFCKGLWIFFLYNRSFLGSPGAGDFTIGFLVKFYIYLDLITPPKHIMKVVLRFGKVWEDLERFGKVWEDLGRFGKVWEDLGRFGRFGKIWKGLGRFGKI